MKSTKMAKGLLLISSGFDSPVAGYLMLKNDVDLIAVHFDNRPFTNDKPLTKSRKLIELLEQKFDKKIKFYQIDHGQNQIKFMKNCENRYRCLLCRRMMFKIAEQIAIKEKCNFLVTGENLAQVASQTIFNLTNADKAVNIKILRPLLCYDKLEIINLAKDISTHDISIEAAICCNAVPRNPVTRSKLHFIKKEESKINIKEMIQESLDKAKVF